MNTVESYIIENPDGVLEKCAKITVDDIATPFTLTSITALDKQYTLSFWVSSTAAGTIKVYDKETATSAKWSRYIKTFMANKSELQIYFLQPGTYYIYHPKLEVGNKATAWSPSPEDIYEKFEELEKKIPKEITDLIGNDAEILYADDVSVSKEVTENGITKETVTVGELEFTVIKAGDFVLLGQPYGEESEDHSKSYTYINAEGLLTAYNAVIYGTVYATDGEFTGTVHATSGDFAGEVKASSGEIGVFDIDPNWGFNSSYFHDSDGVNYEMFLYGKLRHYTVTDYGQYVYRVLQYTHKSGDPETDDWSGETDTLIGAVDDGADGFSTLMYNSRGGHILLNEGVELCGTYVSLPSEVNFVNSENARKALGIDTGYISSTAVPTGSYVDVEITFNKEYSETPYIWLSFISTSSDAGIGSMEAAITERTTTGATVRIFNNSDAERAPGVQWAAIGN